MFFLDLKSISGLSELPRIQRNNEKLSDTQQISDHFSENDLNRDKFYQSFMFLTSLLWQQIEWSDSSAAEIKDKMTEVDQSGISLCLCLSLTQLHFLPLSCVWKHQTRLSKVTVYSIFHRHFSLVCFVSWKRYRMQSNVAETENKARELIPPSPGQAVDLGRVIAVFLSVAWRFAGGLSDRFSSLEHPSVFIHGLYGSFHKTFTP